MFFWINYRLFVVCVRLSFVLLDNPIWVKDCGQLSEDF